ncbi:PDZ domain-containing protein 8-like [Liolophura sinensis]|uniref:PDZ domain-containing protein 8-like n=1 Tax=Liolophura sinensis TaxID=3198878 RepID=UPI0031580525
MLAILLASFLSGVVLTLLVQCLWLKRRFRSLPILPVPLTPQTDTFRLPKELVKLLNDPELKTRKETCLFLNVLFQFLFRELKDTNLVRRWVIRKLNVEFLELLQTTSGKLLDRISVRDFNFGPTFPMVHNAAIKHVQTSEDKQCLEELDIALDIEYQGGFHLAVDADLVFGKSAYLSVKVMELKGCLRLQMTRQPYTHWSLAFYEVFQQPADGRGFPLGSARFFPIIMRPTMEFNVESRFEGRPIPQITSLIVNQIRRSIRKKHTLPNYKMRYKPFFMPYEPPLPARDLYFRGNRIGQGCLEVTVIECSRLLTPPPESSLYCTVSVGPLPWVDMMRIRKTFVVHDVEIVRSPGQAIGLLFKEDFLLERYESVVVIEAVSPDGPAAFVDVRKNDILVAVGGQKVTSQKQAAKLLKNAGERFTIRVERVVRNKSSDVDIKFEEDFINVKDGELRSREDSVQDRGEEDFVHISVKSVIGDTKSLQGSPISERSPQKRSSVAALLRRRTKSSASEVQTGDSPQSSPEVRRRTVNAVSGVESRDKVKDTLRSPLTTPKKQSPLGSGKTPPLSDSSQSSPAHRKFSAERLDDPGLEEMESGSESDIEEDTEVRKTGLVSACQDPIWNEKFRFDVDDEDKYLNVCVWCNIPKKMDKNEAVVKAETDMLLGHVSLTLSDVALDCLMTLQGDAQRTVHLAPVETKAGASRAKLPNLGAHPGFDPNLCFGDITLGFLHTPQKTTLEERKKMTRHPTSIPFTYEPDTMKVSPSQAAAGGKSDEGLHVFKSAQFHTATYCHFCGKKIWLKTALQCHSCDMICHKKCTEKCQAQTLCRKDGLRRRSQPDVLYKTPLAVVEVDKKKTTEEPNRSGGILSKFRKDSTGKKGIKSPNGSPQAARKMMSGNQIRVEYSPFYVRRRNSAPDDNESDGIPASGGLLSVRRIPRTRSTTSLQCLVDQNAPPTLPREEFNKNDDKNAESSGDEGEITISQSRMAESTRPNRCGHNVDEMAVMAAKQMGRELFSHLTLEERKEKLDAMVSKLQQEIDQESEHRAELAKAEQESLDPGPKKILQCKIVKADEKIQALMVLMLHYCAGLQHCMDLEEAKRQEGDGEVAKSVAKGNYSDSNIKGDNSNGEDNSRQAHASSSKSMMTGVRVCTSENNDSDSTSEIESSYELEMELERNSLMSS